MAVALLAAGRADASTLPYIPLDHWATPLITEAIGRGLLPRLSLSDRPYARTAVAEALREARSLADSLGQEWSPYESWLLERLEGEVDPEAPAPTAAFSRATGDWSAGYGVEARARAVTGEDHRRFGRRDVKGILLPYAGFRSERGLAGGIRFRMDADGARVPDFDGRPWRHGWTGDAKNAYVLLDLGHADVILGRDDLRWGASDHASLLLSAYAPAFDQAGLRVRLGPVTASSFFANLDDMVLTAPTAQARGDTLAAGTRVKRHISGHRVRWRVNDRLALGFAEAVVYGGVDRGLEPEYMIPVSVYYAAQWNANKNDNMLGAFTADLRPKKDVQVYGELLVDDFQIDHKSPGDKEPFEGGFLVGQRIYNPLGLDGGLLRVEWGKVQPFTYNQVLPWNRYLYKGEPIGFDLGSDAQAIEVEFRQWVSEQVSWSLCYRLEERGATRATDPWPVPVTGPSDATPFPTFENVPTGEVERRARYST
ncbi:MAG TPA: capsule assembly Wzi family protein, partial [Candidatus Eisenbacteria bacterium]